MSLTIDAIRTWSARTGGIYTEPQGRPATSFDERTARRPLAEVAREQAARLRAVHTPLPPRTARDAKRAEHAARVAEAVQRVPASVPARPAPSTPVQTPESRREQFARLDAMANSLPAGCYALPRRAEAGEGQSTYFFKIFKTRKGNRLVGMTGGVGSFTEHALKVSWQEVALTKIAADVQGAAKLFGDKTAHCGFCAAQGRTSPLTKDRSVAAGYGKHCADKHGLPW